MKKINFKKIFRGKSSAPGIEPSMAWPINYIRDWKVIVLVFAVGMISLSLFGWNIYLSNQIAGGYLAPEDVSTDVLPAKIIKLSKLQADITLLETKQSDYLKLKGSQVKLSDPSL